MRTCEVSERERERERETHTKRASERERDTHRARIQGAVVLERQGTSATAGCEWIRDAVDL